MKHYKIAVVPGDGTGPEVIAEGMKVLNAAERKFGFALDATTYDVGAGRYLATGEILPDTVLDEFRGHDAMFLGAIGDPRVKPGILEKGILLRMRFELDQYINLRPIRLYPSVDTPLKGKGPADIDYCVVRENSGGLYTGMGGISRPDSKDAVATQIMAYTYEQVERCCRYAFEYARKYGKKARGVGDKNTLALVGKSNVLTYMYQLWNRVFAEVGADYPDVERQYFHVDATTLYMVASPEMFDVIVTENMFGDIITDLAAITQGGLLHVRAHRRHRPHVDRQARHQPHRRHRRRRHDARAPRRGRGRPRHHPRHRHRHPQDEEPARQRDGLHHRAGRRHDRRRRRGVTP